MAMSTIALALVAALATHAGNAFARCSPFRDASVPAVAFVADHVGPDDVVLSDLETSWKIPAFTGRIVAAKHPLYWVPDSRERWVDVVRFFTPAIDDDLRRETLRRWGVRFILLDRGYVQLSTEETARLMGLGRTVATSGTLVLIESER